jgi:ligand-binding SRPBCC domain-containing protein
MATELRFESELAVALEVAFDLSLSIDAQATSMGDARGRPVGDRTRGRLGPGDEVTWRAWHWGVPWTLTSRITGYTRPVTFTDEQVRGPFASYRHRHEFRPAPGGTLMIDEIAFAAPLGPIGRLAERLVLRRRVTHIIEARNRELRRLADRPAPSGDA